MGFCNAYLLAILIHYSSGIDQHCSGWNDP